MTTHEKEASAYFSAAANSRKTTQVVMLYDGAIRNVQQAKLAIEEGRIEDRFNALKRACDIIMGLQLSLDFDNGGDVARILYDFYAAIDMRLLSVHSSQSAETCDMVIGQLRQMRDAWHEIDQQQGQEHKARPEDEIDFKNPQVAQSFREVAGFSLCV